MEFVSFNFSATRIDAVCVSVYLVWPFLLLAKGEKDEEEDEEAWAEDGGKVPTGSSGAVCFSLYEPPSADRGVTGKLVTPVRHWRFKAGW